MKRNSALLRDREVHPLQTAVYWIEYILKYNGARHLRVVSLELTWYQYYLLDVYVPIIVGIYLLCKLGGKVFRKLIYKERKVKQS